MVEREGGGTDTAPLLARRKDFSGLNDRLQQEIERVGASGGREVQPHLRSIQAQLEAIARGDYDAVFADAHADVTLDIFAPPEFTWIRQARGPGELRRAVEQNFGSVEEQRPTITSIFAEGDTVVLFGREQGRIRATGAPYDVEFVERFTFRDHRLAGVRIIAAYAVPGR